MYKLIFIIGLLLITSINWTTPVLAEWQVDLEVYSQDQKSDTGNASNNLSFGTTATSSEEYDNKFDTIALLTDPVNAYFYHPEYKSNVQKLWRDFRGDVLPKEWGFEVQSSNANNPINIKWTIQAPDNLHFVLVDKDTGNETDMSSASIYTYNTDSTTPKKFLLKISDNNSLSTVNGNNNLISQGVGSKGGGCGTIKTIDKNSSPLNNSGNMAINMIILLSPLLLPFQNYLRRFALARAKR